MKLLLSILTIILLYSCSVHKHNHHGHANQIMNEKVFEELVNAFESPKRESYQKPNLVVASLGNIKNKNIIDIGAGTGYFSFRLAKKGANVTHADVDDRFLAFAQEKAKSLKNISNFKTMKVPYDSPLMGVSQYDYALMVNTYHHIEDRIDYFKKVKEGLINGGTLVVVDFKKPAAPNEPEEFPRESMRISSERIQEELAQSGFTSFRVDTKMLPYQFVVFAK